jgi:hypothetical protein
MSYTQKFKLPICTSRECASNFNLLLINEKTYDAFLEYLKNNFTPGLRLLLLWTDLNVFKHTSLEPKKDINLLASEIYENYIKENSEKYVDFPSEIITMIENSYKNSKKNEYNACFDEVMQYVYRTLKENYFLNFKQSDSYRELEKDLESDEIIYSRLLASSMISNTELI